MTRWNEKEKDKSFGASVRYQPTILSMRTQLLTAYEREGSKLQEESLPNDMKLCESIFLDC